MRPEITALDSSLLKDYPLRFLSYPRCFHRSCHAWLLTLTTRYVFKLLHSVHSQKDGRLFAILLTYETANTLRNVYSTRLAGASSFKALSFKNKERLSLYISWTGIEPAAHSYS